MPLIPEIIIHEWGTLFNLIGNYMMYCEKYIYIYIKWLNKNRYIYLFKYYLETIQFFHVYLKIESFCSFILIDFFWQYFSNPSFKSQSESNKSLIWIGCMHKILLHVSVLISFCTLFAFFQLWKRLLLNIKLFKGWPNQISSCSI